jgi:hypothetical protein
MRSIDVARRVLLSTSTSPRFWSCLSADGPECGVSFSPDVMSTGGRRKGDVMLPARAEQTAWFRDRVVEWTYREAPIPSRYAPRTPKPAPG